MGDYYANSNYKGTRLGWGSKPVVLVVDLCKAYYTPGSINDIHDASPEAAAVPDMIKELVTAARKGNCPVVWTHVMKTRMMKLYQGPKKSGGKGIFDEDHPQKLYGWIPGYEPGADDLVIHKEFPSAFFGTTLATRLQIMGADTVVVCGVSTSGCVRASTLDALCHGFRPMVVREACGDRNQAIQEGNLYDLNAKYSDVVHIAEAVEHLEKGWAK